MKTDQYNLNNKIRLQLLLYMDKYVWVNVNLVTIRLSYSPTNKHVFKILNSVDMYRIIHGLQKNLSSIIYILYMEGLLRPLSTTLIWIINCQIRHIFVYNLVISSSIIKYITPLPQIWHEFVFCIYLSKQFVLHMAGIQLKQIFRSQPCFPCTKT